MANHLKKPAGFLSVIQFSHHRIPPVPAGYGDHLHPDPLRNRHGAVSGDSGGGKILSETGMKTPGIKAPAGVSCSRPVFSVLKADMIRQSVFSLLYCEAQ